MKKIRFIPYIYTMGLIAMCINPAISQSLLLDYKTAYTYSGQDLTVKWCVPQLIDPLADPELTFELKVVHYESSTVLIDVKDIRAMEYTFTLPMSGHFVVQMRYDLGPEDPREINNWSDSRHTLPANNHCAAHEAFWGYGAIAAPTGGTIE